MTSQDFTVASMTDVEFAPPPSPPAFLGQADLLTLAEQGHLAINLPSKLHEDVTAFFNAIDAFFQLPEDEKSILYPGTASNLELGYHQVPEEKQFLSLRHAASGTGHSVVEELLKPLWHDISHLLYRILCDIGHFLGIDNLAWYHMIQRSLHLPKDSKVATSTLLRAFRYEADKGISEPHLDVGLLTLCLGRGKGLQLWDRSYKRSIRSDMSNGKDLSGEMQADEVGSKGEDSNTAASGWQDAAEVTILVGETLRVLSTNRIWAGMHRVTANPCGRDSIVYALRPDLETTLDLRMFGGSGEVHARALWELIRQGKYNVNATKEVREEVKARNRAEKGKSNQDAE